MSLIFSWMRRKIPDWLAGTFAACACLTSLAWADTGSVRLGMHFYPTAEHRYQGLRTVAEIGDRLKSDMKQFVTGFEGCPAIVTGPLESGTPRDQLRDTWTVVQSISVWCWAILHADPAAQVTATEPADRITLEMIHGIMANAGRLSAEDEDWAKTLIVFPGGEIDCKDRERCRLSLPDGKSPPELSLDFELIMAIGDEQFIQVTQMVYGRSSFVYGLSLRRTQGGDEVISIFPDLRN